MYGSFELKEEGSSATDFVTDVTDGRRKKKEGIKSMILGFFGAFKFEFLSGACAEN